jgi:hypothetical protein
MSDATRLELAARRRLRAVPGLNRALRQACMAHAVHYDRGPGRRVPIALLPVPLVLTRAQERFLFRLSERINGYLRRMPVLYERHAVVRELLCFSDAERAFIEDVWRPEHAGAQSVVSRNDVDMPEDPRRTVVFEPNGCSIGGIYYCGATARVLDEQVVQPHLAPALRRRLAMLPEGQDLLARMLEEHAALVGAPRRGRVALLEDRDWDTGITEMPTLAQHLERQGFRCCVGDPRELALSRGRLMLRGAPVDLIYRNMELADLVAIEKASRRRLTALREAFRRNRVLSGIAGDFDQKGLWELLAGPRAAGLVAPADRAFFRRHLLWTRVLRQVVTESPDGEAVDLVAFARRNRRRLVLKPNLLCGGVDVHIGPRLEERTWQRLLDRALRAPGQWVVQRYHRGTKKRFPTPGGGEAPHFVTFGLISAPFGQGILGRACIEPVVNVSRGGGLTGVFALATGRPATRARRGTAAVTA